MLARRDGRSLAVEAKGGGSARPGSRRCGQKFTRNQKRDHMAVAVLTALQVTSRAHEAAIAFPDDSAHVHLFEGIQPALASGGCWSLSGRGPWLGAKSVKRRQKPSVAHV
jgi:hypothetical protein